MTTEDVREKKGDLDRAAPEYFSWNWETRIGRHLHDPKSGKKTQRRREGI